MDLPRDVCCYESRTADTAHKTRPSMPPQAEAAPTNPPKPRGEATQGSPRQHTNNDLHHVHRGPRSRRCSGQRRCSGALAASGARFGDTSTGDEPAQRATRAVHNSRRPNAKSASRRTASGGARARSPRSASSCRSSRNWRTGGNRRRRPPGVATRSAIACASSARTRWAPAHGRPLTPDSPLTHPSPLLALRAKVKELTRMLDENRAREAARARAQTAAAAGAAAAAAGSAAAAGRAARPAAAAGWAPGRPAGGAAGGAGARAGARRALRDARAAAARRRGAGVVPGRQRRAHRRALATRLLDRPRRAAVDALGRPPRAARRRRRAAEHVAGRTAAEHDARRARQPAPGARTPQPERARLCRAASPRDADGPLTSNRRSLRPRPSGARECAQ